MQKNAQKVYAGYMGCSGVPMGEDQKYSAQEKGKKQKYQVYKIGLNPEKTKISYHKKSESMTQAKMKQLINKKEISFQKLTDKHQNPPYAAKLNKQNTGESLVNHAHHHSVALNSPQDHNIISSSTGSTRELKTVSNRVPKSGKSKTKSNVGVAKASPVLISKSSMHSKATDRMSTTETGRQMGHLTPSVKYSYAKAEMIQSYDHTTPIEYSTKPKTTNLHGQKPTYIILTIDNHGEKGYDRKKETPKSSVNMIATASYAKQGQSYQQLSSLKSKIFYIVRIDMAVGFKINNLGSYVFSKIVLKFATTKCTYDNLIHA